MNHSHGIRLCGKYIHIYNITLGMQETNNHSHGIRLCGKYIHIYNITLGMEETNKVCLKVGALAISDTIELCVITIP